MLPFCLICLCHFTGDSGLFLDKFVPNDGRLLNISCDSLCCIVRVVMLAFTLSATVACSEISLFPTNAGRTLAALIYSWSPSGLQAVEPTDSHFHPDQEDIDAAAQTMI